MPTIVTDMDTHASERMVMALVSRLEREGQHLTVTAIGKMHMIMNDCVPDRRSEGSQKDLSELVRERVIRDDR